MLFSLSLLTSGCYVQSLNVFYADNTIAVIPELMGDWTSQIQMGESVTNHITFWTFGTNTVDTYDGDNAYSELEVVYFKLDGTYFMDFTAGRPLKGRDSLGNFYWGAGLTLVHSLCKLQIENDTLTLIPLDLDWFTDSIKEGTLDIPYIRKHKSSNYIFTATPEEWIEFLDKHKDNEMVFNPKYKFVFQRKDIAQRPLSP